MKGISGGLGEWLKPLVSKTSEGLRSKDRSLRSNRMPSANFLQS